MRIGKNRSTRFESGSPANRPQASWGSPAMAWATIESCIAAAISSIAPHAIAGLLPPCRSRTWLRAAAPPAIALPPVP